MREQSAVWIRNESSLSSLRVVLESWVSECRRYGEIVEDHCWWHNERANVSVLAVSAGRVDWAAIEEFGTEKKRAIETKSEGHGRCDLYLCSPKHRKEFALEAKVAWQRMSTQTNAADIGMDSEFPKIDEQWRHAWSDAGALSRDEADHRVAALFIVPYLDDREFRSDRLVEYARGLPGIDACAYYFCDSSSLIDGSSGHFYPGVILALRHRKRSS